MSKKIIFVDGSQGVGKSTLISEVSRLSPVSVYKFPFSEYSNTFNLNSPESLKGFQLGKDLATLYFLSNLAVDTWTKLVVDRGPMSTVYYSLVTGRMSIEEVEEFFKILEKSSNKFSYIFVVARNRPGFNRDKKDGFDTLWEEEVDPGRALEVMLSLSKKYNIQLRVFENDFSESLWLNSYKFYEVLKEEL